MWYIHTHTTMPAKIALFKDHSNNFKSDKFGPVNSGTN